MASFGSILEALLKYALCAGLACGVTLGKASAQSILDGLAPFDAVGGSNGLVLTIYGHRDIHGITCLRVNHLFYDYETKGFFRIGALPIVVMKDVTFVLNQPKEATNAMATWHSWTSKSGARRLELRQVTFLVNSTTTNRLDVGRIRPGTDGQWILLNGVTLHSERGEVQSGEGTLQVTGENAGRLVLNTRPTVITNLIPSSNESTLVEKYTK